MDLHHDDTYFRFYFYFIALIIFFLRKNIEQPIFIILKYLSQAT